MKNIYIYCEGQTEEAFINEVLAPYLHNWNIWCYPITCTTKRTKKAIYKGGVSDYNKIKNELSILCKQHKNEFLTTMFDYYAMPSNTPNIDNATSDIYERIRIIEEAITSDIAMPNLFFNLILHEFEGLLFSAPTTFKLVAEETTVAQIAQIRCEAVSPEHINNSLETAPSKRLEKLIPNYPKVKNGTIIAKNTGIDIIMSECKHFAEWVEKIKKIGV